MTQATTKLFSMSNPPHQRYPHFALNLVITIMFFAKVDKKSMAGGYPAMPIFSPF